MKRVPRRTGPHKILLVSDDARHRDSQAGILMTHGYDVDCVGSATAGQDCHDASPDLVLVGLGENISRSFGLVQTICSANPGQRVGFLLREGQYLSSVFLNGSVVAKGEGPGDIVERVAALLQQA